MRMTIGYKRVF